MIRLFDCRFVPLKALRIAAVAIALLALGPAAALAQNKAKDNAPSPAASSSEFPSGGNQTSTTTQTDLVTPNGRIADYLAPSNNAAATERPQTDLKGSTARSQQESDSEPLNLFEERREERATRSVWDGLDNLNILSWIPWIFVLLVLAFLTYWGSSIVMKLSHRKRYEEAQIDDQPSVDERLISELAPMEIALLRGNADGFYSKCYALMSQLLKSRGLLAKLDSDADEIVVCLRTQGADPAFLDCTESIARRCEAVRFEGAHSDHNDNTKMIQDIRTLIRMNPFPSGRGHRREAAPREAVEREIDA